MLNDAVKAEESLEAESISEKIDRLNTLSRKHYGFNCKRALSIAGKALALSKEHGYEKGWAQSLVSMSMAYSRMSQCDMSITSLFEAIPLLQKTGEKEDEVKALNLIGINYFFYSRLDQALEYYNRSMNLAIEIGDETFICKILNNIGEIYNEMNKLDEAMEYYTNSFKTASKVNDMLGKAISLSNMGQVSFKLGRNPDALKYYRKSNAILQKVNDKIYLADNMNKIGEVYRKLGVDKKALDNYFKSLQIFEEQGEKFYQTDVYINLSFLYIGKKEYEKAADSLKTALAIAENISARKKVYSIHNHLTNLYEAMGDYKNALHHYKLHHKVERDVSIEELERQLNMAKMQYQIEQTQKEAEIVKLKNIELKKKADEVQKKAQELEESNENINVISEIGQKITSTLSFTRILNTVYRNMNSLMDATCFGIALYNVRENIIEFKIYIDRSIRVSVKSISLDNKGSLAAWCIKNCKEICMNDFETEHTRYIEKNESADSPDEPQSVIYCPLLIEKKVIGVITIQSYSKNAYTLSNLNTVKALGSYIAIALNNSRKSQEIREQAAKLASVNSRLSTEIAKRKDAQKSLEEANHRLENLLLIDVLTGIFNRRGFEKSLRFEWRRSVREGIPLSIILIDIDFFKEYNDRHGHISGDACLKKVSGILQSAVKRPMDLIARFGGEEFIVILPNTTADGALVLAEKMRESVEASKIAHGSSVVSPYLTISLGTSTIIPTMSHSKKEFINSADQALYKAKQTGRNRVCSS